MEGRLYQPISLMLKLTDFCPNNCLDGNYCFSGCSPRSNRWIDKSRVEDIFRQANDEGIREVCYVSSEPFTDLDLLVDVTAKASRAGVVPRFLVTNGRIGASYANALENFGRIRDTGFTMSVDDSYFGSGYNGIDVSVDQFHRVPSEHLSNTIIAALEVFGPTIYVNIRNTVPSKKYLDHTTLNGVVELLQGNEKFSFLDKSQREIVFHDGCRVKVTQIPINRFGNAKELPDDYFTWINFSLGDLVDYKDLRDLIRFGMKRGIECVSPFHKLYLDPDGECYPELGRFRVLSGGNAYHTSLREIIENIDSNPLIPVIASSGFSGILLLLERAFGITPDLCATGDLHLHDRYLSQIQLMRRLKNAIRESGLNIKLREIIVPKFELLRKRVMERAIH